MKRIAFLILIIVGVILSGCTNQEQTIPTPVTTTEIVNHSEEVVTTIETIIPTPIPTNDIKECYNRSLQNPPQYCYDLMYWVPPTPVPPMGTGYTARVWRNDGCINMNKTSDVCEGWGDGLYTAVILHNLSVVKNITGIENPDLIAAVTYYNVTYHLNTVNDVLSFDDFINKYWTKTYSSTKYNASAFSTNESEFVIPIVNEGFNPDAYDYSSTIPLTTSPTPFINVTQTNVTYTNITTTPTINETQTDNLVNETS